VYFAGTPWKVTSIDPAGPAAGSGIAIGDIVLAVDGVDANGDDARLANELLRAPPGTTVHLGLKRGATVSVMRAPRR
jgi:C-terminal processing protease CtpA/Prc